MCISDWWNFSIGVKWHQFYLVIAWFIDEARAEINDVQYFVKLHFQKFFFHKWGVEEIGGDFAEYLFVTSMDQEHCV